MSTPAGFRQLICRTANIVRFEERQEHVLDSLVRVQALAHSARAYLKASHGDEADEHLLALLDMAAETAGDGIEALPPLSVLTDGEGGAA